MANKILAVLLAVTVMLCTIPCATAEGNDGVFTSGNFKYIILEDGTVSIVKCNADSKEIQIPAILDGKKVTSIGDKAFTGCSSLQSVSIPGSITAMGVNPFYNCHDLIEISVANDSKDFSVIDGCLFSSSDMMLIAYPVGMSNDVYTIPEGTIAIGDYAFCESDLMSVIIPDSVTSIGEEAFYCCRKLSYADLPDSIVSIKEDAFGGCSFLSTMNIPASVQTIEGNPFVGCSKLNSIKVNVENATFASIDDVLFRKENKSLIAYPAGKDESSYDVPQGILIIGDNAFSTCRSLVSISIPDSVTVISDSAFTFCEALESITIPDSVITIGAWAFNYCTSLAEVNISGSVVSIGDKAFSNCSSLNRINLPSSVTELGENPLIYCSNLRDITVDEENQVYEVVDGCLFRKADKMLVCYPSGKIESDFSIPDGTIAIGPFAFSDCRKLTSISIPDSVISIAESAIPFYNTLTLIVSRNSYAALFAEERGYFYTYPDANDWLSN